MRKKITQFFEGQTQLPFGKQGGLWSAAHPWERRGIVFMGFLLMALSLVYAYSVMTSVMHVAAREELSIEATRLSAEVARLEGEFLSRTDAITETYAREHGFVTLADRTFVEKTSTLSLNSGR